MPSAAKPVRIPAGEAASAALCLLVVALFTGFVLVEGSVSPAEHLLIVSACTGIAVALIVGAFIVFAAAELLRSGRGSGWKASPLGAIRSALAKRWTEDRLLSLAWPVALFLILVPSFTAFKQRILPKAGFVYDPELAAIDRAMFGSDPGILLHDLIGSPGMTRFLDAIYHGWFLQATIGVCIVALCAGTRTRAQYMLAYSLVWIGLGAICAYLVPAAGPAFYEALVGPVGAEPFRAVHEQLLIGGEVRFLTSLGNQAFLLENLGSPALVIGGGISAIPSIHNALAALFALVSFRAGRLPGLLMSAFAVLIWVGSVYLNWHYAIDGIVGAAGAILIWFASGWIVDRLLAAVAKEPGAVPAIATAAA